MLLTPYSSTFATFDGPSKWERDLLLLTLLIYFAAGPKFTLLRPGKNSLHNWLWSEKMDLFSCSPKNTLFNGLPSPDINWRSDSISLLMRKQFLIVTVIVTFNFTCDKMWNTLPPLPLWFLFVTPIDKCWSNFGPSLPLQFKIRVARQNVKVRTFKMCARNRTELMHHWFILFLLPYTFLLYFYPSLSLPFSPCLLSSSLPWMWHLCETGTESETN